MGKSDIRKCRGGSCGEEVKVYCKNCSQFFCENQEKEHSEFLDKMKVEHEVTTMEEFLMAEREETYQYCARHPQTKFNLACEFCYQPFCPDCFDDTEGNPETIKCRSSRADEHKRLSVKLVAEKIRGKLQNILCEFRANQTLVIKDITAKREKYDEEMDAHRAELEKLTKKVNELHKMLDDRDNQLKQSVKDYMERKSEIMNELEAEYAAYQKKSAELHDRVSDLSNRSSEFIVKENQAIRGELDPLMQFKLQNKEHPPKMSLLITNDPVTFPISINTNNQQTPQAIDASKADPIRILKSLKLKYTLETPSKSTSTFCAKYLQDGRLIHSGFYPIEGLGFDHTIPTNANERIISLYQYRSSLFAMQYINSSYHVHHIDLKTHSVQKSIIKLATSTNYVQQLTVSDEFIVVANCAMDSIQFYSLQSHQHLFDIKDTSIFKQPRGLALLANHTILVGDCDAGQVVSMKISKKPTPQENTPQVKWVCAGINMPYSMFTDGSSQTIFVGEYSTPQVHILSYQGEKFSTVALPSFPAGNLFDMSVYNKQLSVTSNCRKILTYEMEYKDN